MRFPMVQRNNSSLAQVKSAPGQIKILYFVQIRVITDKSETTIFSNAQQS